MANFIARHGQTFEEAAIARQAASGDHCRRETPLFAASIGRHQRDRVVTTPLTLGAIDSILIHVAPALGWR